MITVLVVGGPTAEVLRAAADRPSVEALTALGSEDAIEKLARNRRIDAVLLLAGKASREIAVAIREEDPAGPPLFAPARPEPIPGVHALQGDGLKELLAEVGRQLSGSA